MLHLQRIPLWTPVSAGIAPCHPPDIVAAPSVASKTVAIDVASQPVPPRVVGRTVPSRAARQVVVVRIVVCAVKLPKQAPPPLLLLLLLSATTPFLMSLSVCFQQDRFAPVFWGTRRTGAQEEQ